MAQNTCNMPPFRGNGTGSKDNYTFGFDYINRADVEVYVGDINGAKTKYTEGNADNSNEYEWKSDTEITLNAVSGTDNVIITRVTDMCDPVAEYFTGAAITSEDLNNNQEQALFLAQEIAGRLDGPKGDGDDSEFWNRISSTQTTPIQGQTVQQGETWQTGDDHVATSGAIEDRYWNNVNIDSSGDTFYDSSTTAWNGTDNTIATTAANDTQYETLVQEGSPSTNVTGKTWFRDSDDILFIWNGSTWVPVKGSTAGDTTYDNVFFVSKENGDDVNNDGHSITKALASLDRAVKLANGDIAGQAKVDNALIYVFPGNYNEPCPIGGGIKAKNMSIVGQSMRSTYVFPDVESISSYDPENPDDASNELKTMWACNSGTYIANLSFAGMKAKGTRGDAGSLWTDSTYGLPPKQGWIAGFYDGGGTPITLKRSPYIQNCTVFSDSKINCKVAVFDPDSLPGGEAGDTDSAPTGGGILVDGSVPATTSPIKSFVVDSFTQVNLDGPGVLATNMGYAQLVSFFGTFCHFHAAAIKGGQLNLSNCTTDFGSYGLIASGKSDSPVISGGGVKTKTAISGFTAGSPPTPGTTTSVTVEGLTTATQPGTSMIMKIGANYYAIEKVTKVSGGECTITPSNPNPNKLDQNLNFNPGTVNAGAAVEFYQGSYISSGGHTFEYTGFGTNYGALPRNGGVLISGNAKTVQNGGESGCSYDNSAYNGGRVWQSSTDEEGNFTVGTSLVVEQKSGKVNLVPGAISSSLVSDLTPDLGGDLDVNGFKIVGDRSGGTGDIVFETNSASKVTFNNNVELLGTGYLKVPCGTEGERPGTAYEGYFRFNKTSASFEGYNGTEWAPVGGIQAGDIGTDPNQIPLNQMLGQMAFVDNVATLRPYSNTGAQPVFNGEMIVIWDDANNKLIQRIRKPNGTVVSLTSSAFS